MRVLLTYFTFPPATNGVARYLGDMAESLTKRGHKVEVICGGVDKKKVERQGNLRVHRLPFYSFRTQEESIKISEKMLKYLESIHRKRKIDLIEAQGLIGEFATPYAIALNMFSLMHKVPLVLRFHGMAISETQKSMAKTLFWKKIINVCNKGSEAMYAGKVSLEKIQTQHNAVNLENFRPELGNKWLRSRIEVSEKDFLIGTAGRIIGPLPLGPNEEDPTLEEKGIIDLIKAFGNSMKDKKNTKLIIAAAAPPEDLQERFNQAENRIKELAKIMGVENRVLVKTFKMEEMPLFYNGLDLFVLPSHAEACPFVVLEAMACKIPVIATSVGGIPEIVTNGESGFLVEVGDTVELGKTLRDLIKSPKKRENAAAAAIKSIQEKHDLNKTVEKVIGLYNSIISNGKKIKKKREIIKENYLEI